MSQSDNKLLAALPRREYERVRPSLHTLHLAAESPLPQCGHARVYFPGTAVCSIITRMADGGAIEVACIGSEGVVGLHALAGEAAPVRNGFVQVADGTVQYMAASVFERELAQAGAFRDVIDNFCHAFLETMIVSVACNRLHSIDERCCRWLLGVHDRLGRGRFELSVSFIARVLGAKRPVVARTVASLQKDGLITHDGSSVTILDAIGLRRRACRCYDAMKRSYTVPSGVSKPNTGVPESEPARVLRMRPGREGCTLCGLSTRLPHKNGHECILALDEEVAALVTRAHSLRKYRAQLMKDRSQLYRDILKRSNARI